MSRLPGSYTRCTATGVQEGLKDTSLAVNMQHVVQLLAAATAGTYTYILCYVIPSCTGKRQRCGRAQVACCPGALLGVYSLFLCAGLWLLLPCRCGCVSQDRRMTGRAVQCSGQPRSVVLELLMDLSLASALQVPPRTVQFLQALSYQAGNSAVPISHISISSGLGSCSVAGAGRVGRCQAAALQHVRVYKAVMRMSAAGGMM